MLHVYDLQEVESVLVISFDLYYSVVNYFSFMSILLACSCIMPMHGIHYHGALCTVYAVVPGIFNYSTIMLEMMTFVT